MKEAFTPLSSNDGSPVSLKASPLVANWVEFSDNDNEPIRIYTGKVELGQHILTALAQIAADALHVPLSRVRIITATTSISPDESVTSGSLSVQHSGMSIRAACRHARHLFVQAAATAHNTDPENVIIADDAFYIQGKRIGSYARFAALVNLAVPIDMEIIGTAKDAPNYVGKPIADIALADKVNGRYRFIHDYRWPNMLFGGIVRPPSIGAKLQSISQAPAAALEGVVSVVIDGSMVGVIATHEHIAHKACQLLAKTACWEEQTCLPSVADLTDWMQQQPFHTVSQTQHASRKRHNDSVSKTFSGNFFKPFLKHASIGPSCAAAYYCPDNGLQVWSHTQGIYNLRTDLSIALNIDERTIEVHHAPGAGCYGHNGADDVAFDAAWLSTHVPGKHVLVQWTRADEFCWAPQSPPMAVEIHADTDHDGNIIDWRHTVWGPGHSMRPGRATTSTLLGSWYTKAPQPAIPAINAPLTAGGGSERNMLPCYDINCSAINAHRILHMPVRTSSLRSLGAFANVFAIESMLDDIAREHGVDPIEYRLRILSDPRGIDVINAVRSQSNWHHRQALKDNNGDVLKGFGVGYAHYKNKGAYCAVIAEVSIDHEIRINSLYIAVDVGEIINPDGVCNQIEGGAVQACSWALLEEARFSDRAMTDTTWEDYPILRCNQTPNIHVELLNRPNHAAVGAGEGSVGPTAAAVANAICDASGARVRTLPLNFERISRAL